MNIHSLYHLLRQVEFFSDLSFNEIEFLISALELKKFKKGKNIIKQGEEGDCLYLISKGKVSIWINSGFLKKKLVGYLSDNQYFGEMALLDDQIRKATAVTDTDCDFYLLSRTKFWDVLMKNPKIKEKIMNTVQKREQSSQAKQNNTKSDNTSPSWLAYRFKKLFK